MPPLLGSAGRWSASWSALSPSRVLVLNNEPTSSVVTATGAASLLAAALACGSTWYSSCQTSKTKETEADNSPESSTFRVEVHLMDKIQQKTYLESVQDAIPSTLRILAIDLPEMRTKAFSGDCRLAHDKHFLDQVAPPKVVTVDPLHDNSTPTNGKGHSKTTPKQQSKTQMHTLKIPQKALVKSLIQCRSPQSQQRVGVEVLEASVSGLNKHLLRKTHQFGNFKYDPGKYYKEPANAKQNTNNDEDEEEMSEVADDDDDYEYNIDAIDVPLDKATFRDELEAPWNQYAWAEELRLRINGQVGFDAPMEKASSWNQYLFGQAYKVTIHPVFRFWEWPLPAFARSDPDGVDGRTRTSDCRSCNKPHVVIANGAALQRVPSSLRLLQKLCRKADVPLFVIHDPRVWGGNTHSTLAEALKDVRGTVKTRVIRQALKQQGSTAFSRGRMLGQLETEAKWQIKEQKRKSKEVFDSRRRRSKADSDWSLLDSIRLEKRLVERGVITEAMVSDGEGSSVTQRTYKEALVVLARRVIEAQEKSSERNNSSDEDDDLVDSPKPNDRVTKRAPTKQSSGAAINI